MHCATLDERGLVDFPDESGICQLRRSKADGRSVQAEPRPIRDRWVQRYAFAL